MNRASPIFIGIDGGGTRSVAVVADSDGTVLSQARAGSLNFLGSGVAEARRNLRKLVNAVGGNRTEGQMIRRAVVGCAALFAEATPMEKRMLCRGIMPLPSTRVVSDCQTAYFGATLGAPGIVVIAGTGSIVLAGNERGRMVRVGGWGHVLGDEGSAYWIARESVKASIAAEEQRGPKTRLGSVVRRWFGVRRLSNLVSEIHRSDSAKDRLASLAGHLSRGRWMREPVFREICGRAGRELALQTIAAARLAGLKSRHVPVFCIGSVITGNRVVRSSFVAELNVQRRFRLATPALSPVLGAAAMALSDADVALTPAVIANLVKSSGG